MAQVAHKTNAILHLGHIAAKMLEAPPLLPGQADPEVKD
jgi:hypothetical protein